MTESRHEHYSDWVASYLVSNFGERSVDVYRSVTLGTSEKGDLRQADILIVSQRSRRALVVECRSEGDAAQMHQGIIDTIRDLNTLQMPGVLVYGGAAFPPKTLQTLWSSGLAARCEPSSSYQPSSKTRELDQLLAMQFHWWDLLVAGRIPFST